MTSVDFSLCPRQERAMVEEYSDDGDFKELDYTLSEEEELEELERTPVTSSSPTSKHSTYGFQKMDTVQSSIPYLGHTTKNCSKAPIASKPSSKTAKDTIEYCSKSPTASEPSSKAAKDTIGPEIVRCDNVYERQKPLMERYKRNEKEDNVDKEKCLDPKAEAVLVNQGNLSNFSRDFYLMYSR